MDTREANISQWMRELDFSDVPSFHHWTYTHGEEFWQKVITTLPIIFKANPTAICDLSDGVTAPNWFPNGSLNIVDSCFNADPNKTAFIYPNAQHQLATMTYGQLGYLVNQICNGLIQQQFKAGDAIAIIMPMHPLACAIYLAIIKMGGVVVSIAESFSPAEIAVRLKIANAKAVFTQLTISWGEKSIPLYEKVKSIQPNLIILTDTHQASIKLTPDAKTLLWEDFLDTNTQFTSVSCHPLATCNILFSSGTTGTPKAIPWNHTTPIRAASDAYFHQNMQADDVIAWPTSLGWMMGPWLIFAGLINHATIALYTGSPKERAFLDFIVQAKVTVLGLVPTLVAAWKQSRILENLNFSHLKLFSSSGECSNENDMRYLMEISGGKPIIEYCGGTEIGGAYLSSTVVQQNIPAQFSTPTMGTRIVILNADGIEATLGEVAIVPPTIGLSTTVLNADHEAIYYANMPRSNQGEVLRRHGDQIEKLDSGYYRIQGRVDDTMNLGGIKVSSAEIERTLIGIPDITELAAIAIPLPNGGPNQLIIIAVTKENLDTTLLQKEMQKRINQELNPLFKIHAVYCVGELPKTTSNKIMRRTLREEYMLRV